MERPTIFGADPLDVALHLTQFAPAEALRERKRFANAEDVTILPPVNRLRPRWIAVGYDAFGHGAATLSYHATQRAADEFASRYLDNAEVWAR